MPKNIKPMLALSTDNSFDGKDWLFEIKWDGYRAIAQIQNGMPTIFSRNQKLLNDRFPEIIDSLKKLNFTAVFDGEITAVDERGVSNFQSLQNYVSFGRGKENLLYYIFDIIFYEEYDLEGLMLWQRKKILEDVLPTLARILAENKIPPSGRSPNLRFY